MEGWVSADSLFTKGDGDYATYGGSAGAGDGLGHDHGLIESGHDQRHDHAHAVLTVNADPARRAALVVALCAWVGGGFTASGNDSGRTTLRRAMAVRRPCSDQQLAADAITNAATARRSEAAATWLRSGGVR